MAAGGRPRADPPPSRPGEPVGTALRAVRGRDALGPGRLAQLDPNLTLKDDHRLAPDAKVFTFDLNLHETRPAGTLE